MKRTLKLILVGTLPLWLGIVINAVLSVMSLPIFIVSTIFLVVWGVLSNKAAISWQDPLPQALLMNAFGFLMLILVVIQELSGGYWVNYLGMATQLYFIPGLAFFAVVIGRLMETITVLPLYVAEAIAMFLISWLGCYRRYKKGR